MCCKRRTDRQALTVAKLAQDQPTTTSRAVDNESLGPPPAYEQIEKESKDITSSIDIGASNFVDNQGLSNTRAVPVFTSNNTTLSSSLDNTTMYTPRSTCQSRCAAKHAAKYERKQQKHERRLENRLEKREYRQEKRELRQERRDLRAEHRSERKEMRRGHGGPISMLIEGVSNLMKK